MAYNMINNITILCIIDNFFMFCFAGFIPLSNRKENLDGKSERFYLRIKM